MGSSKKQIMTSIEKIVKDMNGIEIKMMEIDGEEVNRLETDGDKVGLVNEKGDWFFPLEELTVNELKMVKTMMKEMNS